MQILIVAPGSAGDVLPLAGLGARLRGHGHDVALAAHEPFRAAATGAGLAFRPLRGDPRGLGASEAGQRWQAAGRGPVAAARMAGLMRAYVADMGQDVLTAAGRGAEVMLLNPIAVFTGCHVAEGLGIPSAGVFPAPLHPTGEFAPASLGARTLAPRLNRAAGRAVLAASSVSFRRTTRELRAQLGLPPLRGGSLWRHLEARRWPVLHGFSTAVLPRPADWRPGLEIVGYWWPAPRPGWQPPAALTDFLAAGPTPVFIGFGSMATGQGERLAGAVLTAVRRAGVRAVVQAGWAGLQVHADDVLTVDEVPHDWLFPRVAAVVHHAGAGTAAAGLRAGVPAVVVPVLADQPFWAARLHALGVAPRPVPLPALTADRLAAALRTVTTDARLRDRAVEVSARITAEDGAGRVGAWLDTLR